MKNNVIKIKEPMKDNKNNSKFMSFTTRLGEYILFILTAAIIIYFVFKSVFGTPFQQKMNHDNIVEVLNQVDTIKAMESYNMDNIHSMKDTLGEILFSVKELKTTVDIQTKEINNMKKVVNQKIQSANRVIYNTNTSTKVNTPVINTSKNKVLDSFFRSKHNNYSKPN